MLAVVACGDGNGTSSVTGHVVSVTPASLTGVAALEIVDSEGETWRFVARGFVGFTPSHLEEHRGTGQAVKVEYFEEDGELVISRVTDG